MGRVAAEETLPGDDAAKWSLLTDRRVKSSSGDGEQSLGFRKQVDAGIERGA